MSGATFTISRAPVSKQRPRFNRQTGKVHTPEKTAAFEREVGFLARPHFPEPIAGPVKMTIFATFETAKSWSKKRTEEHLHRPHTQKPDLDNIAKAISDALNGIAFVDDSQIAEIYIRKVWGRTSFTVVSIEGMA